MSNGDDRQPDAPMAFIAALSGAVAITPLAAVRVVYSASADLPALAQVVCSLPGSSLLGRLYINHSFSAFTNRMVSVARTVQQMEVEMKIPSERPPRQRLKHDVFLLM